MSDTTNKGNKTVCNYQTMFLSNSILSEIAERLAEAYQLTSGLSQEFQESYEGEAEEEVSLFLENLPKHLYKLSLFYGRMAQYVAVTTASFAVNDETLADKMGR